VQKNYLVNWQDDRVESLEVDGVRYATPEEIPDPADRAQIEALIAKGPEGDFDPQDLALPAGTPFPLTRIVFTVFAAVAVLMLGIAAFSGAGAVRRLKSEVSAAGQVLELVERRDETGQAYYYPRVAFSLPDGSRKEVLLAEGSWPPAYELGQEVEVRVDPARPLEARIKSGAGASGLWIVPIITGVLGMELGLAAWMVQRVFRFESA
jgi:hypothetical protein